jgi:hypothetical protein
MPKSMTTGSPSSSSSTLPGLRSRCTTRRRGSPPARHATRARGKSPADSGPRVSTRSSGVTGSIPRGDGPSPDGSQSMISATLQMPDASQGRDLALEAARRIVRVCDRNTLTATARPCGSRADGPRPLRRSVGSGGRAQSLGERLGLDRHGTTR